MTKIKLFALAVLFVSAVAVAQNCDDPVVDQAGVLGGQIPQVAQAAEGLTRQGADPRIWTVRDPGPAGLDRYEALMERQCASWRAPSGARKSTLLVLMVAPTAHKMGVYYGGAWDKAFDAHWNRIKQDYMGPHFKTGDFAGGLIAASNQFAARITASQDEAVHPAVTTVTQQATDLSGLWTVMKWLLAIIFFGCLAWLLLAWTEKKRTQMNDKLKAQREAITWRNQVVSLLSSVRIKVAGDKDKLAQYDAISEEFGQIAGELSNDPYQNGLRVEDYNAMTQVYGSLANRLNTIIGISTFSTAEEPKITATEAPEIHHIHHTHKVASPEPEDSGTRKETVVVHDNSGDFATGVLLGSVLSDRGGRQREGSDRDDGSGYRDSSNRSSDSDGGGGGSSSWSDSSSDSSSDSFGGGSSDFGSSSGGDFGGGGGGGSSDF